MRATEANSFYAPARCIRFAFIGPVGSSAVTHYSCRRRASDGNPRNCDVIGAGSYAIADRGDGRVLTLSGVPGIAGSLNYDLILVRRADKVYFGFKDKLGMRIEPRLSKVATDALFNALGIPLVQGN